MKKLNEKIAPLRLCGNYNVTKFQNLVLTPI
jgi:hypothetical protein